ncbi:MAG: orotate phosphoribosyltransferase [Bacteroidota bacterium]|nr:orotate phosphoribosyltransferase [Bacteroidota bacterium]
MVVLARYPTFAAPIKAITMLDMAVMEESTKISKDAISVAETLLDIDSIQLKVSDPFTWVSGIESPIYCDNRRVNSYVEVRNKLVSCFVDLIREKFPQVEVIAGVATGGIPLGVLIADRMELPFIYARQAPKEHGLKRQVEGDYTDGQKVVLIEDHISTGGSSLIAINAIRAVNLNLLGLVSIMTYNFKAAKDQFAENNVNFYSLCDLETILDVSIKRGSITEEEKNSILEFKANPSTWGTNRKK